MGFWDTEPEDWFRSTAVHYIEFLIIIFNRIFVSII
jgi:hypothetical protein